MNVLSERATIEMYRLQQSKTWTSNIIGALETTLTAAGLHSRLEHLPAMCFLDITGYTRLTQERGDAAAAHWPSSSAASSSERRSSTAAGRSVARRWGHVLLPGPWPGSRGCPGDGGRRGRRGVATGARGPPLGPVIFQEGDYYGQTVNVASRIAEYARPGEVLVSQDVVDAAGDAAVAFREIGPVELKGVGGAMRLHTVSRAG